MIASVIHYRATRTTSTGMSNVARANDEACQPRGNRVSLIPLLTPPASYHRRVWSPKTRDRLLLHSTNSNGASRYAKRYRQPALTSVLIHRAARANESSKTKRERDTSARGCPRGVPLPPSLLFSPPSSISPSPALCSFAFLLYCPLYALSLSSSPSSLSLPPSVPFFYYISFSHSHSLALSFSRRTL